MGHFVVDQASSKAAVIELIEALGTNPSADTTDTCLNLIKEHSRDWNVDHGKLRALLKSQLMSGNARGAIKLINNSIPDQRLRLLPGLILAIVLWPFRFVGSILSLGLKK